jgi:hypothetical protein
MDKADPAQQAKGGEEAKMIDADLSAATHSRLTISV